MKNNCDDKLKRISSLSEKKLRNVVAALLLQMGFHNVRVIHSNVEKGKDIIGYKNDEFDCRRALACIVKTGNINGNANSNRSIQTLVNQATQALYEEYTDTQLGNSVAFNEIKIITSGRIMPSAEESISDSFEKLGHDKIIRFIEGTRLVELIDKYMPKYWSKDAQPIINATVKKLEKMLVKLCKTYPDVVLRKEIFILTIRSTDKALSVIGEEIQRYLTNKRNKNNAH